ncbi:DNA repair and recombination protein RadA [uncultured archaeon]|nr:DNA repair and recombination protein RadA [uncultured archaeon]
MAKKTSESTENQTPTPYLTPPDAATGNGTTAVQTTDGQVITQPPAAAPLTEKPSKPMHEIIGISASTFEKLVTAGYESMERIAMTMPGELVELAGVSEDTANKAVRAARQHMQFGFQTGDKVLEKRRLVNRVTTGSKELDALLGGGVETQAITEAFGKFSSGKSQFAFQLCVTAQLPVEQGGLGGNVLFIDTENTFRPERIVQMAAARGLNADDVLKNIHVARSYNSDHQMLLVEKAEEIIRNNNIRLVVVDSLTAGFRADYTGRGTLAERQQKLNKHVHALQKLADLHNLAVYVTNQVIDRPDILFGDPTSPVGGNVLAHMSTYRLYFRRSKENRRIAKIVDSPNLPDGECVFTVNEGGLGDAE